METLLAAPFNLLTQEKEQIPIYTQIYKHKLLDNKNEKEKLQQIQQQQHKNTV